MLNACQLILFMWVKSTSKSITGFSQHTHHSYQGGGDCKPSNAKTLGFIMKMWKKMPKHLQPSKESIHLVKMLLQKCMNGILPTQRMTYRTFSRTHPKSSLLLVSANVEKIGL